MARFLPSSAAPAAPWAARRAQDGYGEGDQPDWRSIDWPSHQRQVEIGGSRVNYVDIGSPDAPPVVLVHGLGGQWQNWLENVPRLAQERRVLALDLPGFGASEMPRERISISGYARVVHALIRQAGIGRASVVGNSMGGFISSEVAIQFPEAVDRLVLVSAAGITSANVYRAPAVTVGRIATAITAYTAGRHRDIASRPVSRHLALSLVARHPSLIKPDLAWEAMFTGTGRPGFADALRACLEYDFRERLPEISSPTLIVWGEKDSILSVRDADEFERLIPDSRKVVMEDTGHVPMLERPRAFNDTLLDFLAETGPAEEREPVQGESQAV